MINRILPSLKTKSFPDVNFVVTDGTATFHYDNFNIAIDNKVDSIFIMTTLISPLTTKLVAWRLSLSVFSAPICGCFVYSKDGSYQ